MRIGQLLQPSPRQSWCINPCPVPHRTVRRLAQDGDPCRVSQRGPKRKRHLQAVEGSACQRWIESLTYLELKGLTGFRDQVRTLVCARVLHRYSSPYIPRVGISRFPRLRPYSRLAEVACDIIKELRASPSRILWLRRETRSLCILTCRRRHPAQRARAPSPCRHSTL